MKLCKLISLLLVFISSVACQNDSQAIDCASQVLVAKRSEWKYDDSGTDLGTMWRESSYDDSDWPAGKGVLGFGESYISTELRSGFITYYFRLEFDVEFDPGVIEKLAIAANYDDGFVAYLNGIEIRRESLTLGQIDYLTTARSHEGGSYARIDISQHIDKLKMGTNLLAVEVHQRSTGSSDVVMDMELSYSLDADANCPSRGPYLQLGTPNSIVVRWRTDEPAISRIAYGTDPARLDREEAGTAMTEEHEISLTGLQPATTYFYAIVTETDTLVSGDDYSFITPPPSGTPQRTRVWVLGDCGTANANAEAVRDAYLAFNRDTHTDLWVMLGDNAYENGTDQEYQNAVFDLYPSMLRKSVLWPAFGNHDGRSANSGNQTGVFYDIFTLPTMGEAGGMPSGTEAYYSFDYANIHFVCLNSHDIPRGTDAAMLTWLRDDLAANSQDWTIAFWHHPPYSKGSHDSDTEGRLIDMRQNALPILEQGGVDLIMTGHSHSYERSYLLDGHYGRSLNYFEGYAIDGGDGRAEGDGAYSKPTLGSGSHEGTVYMVAGSSGKTSGGSLDHPAMYLSLNELGSAVLDIDSSRLEVAFIGTDGGVLDRFTIEKGAQGDLAPATPAGLEADSRTQSSISLSWVDEASSERGFKLERKSDGDDFVQIATLGIDVISFEDENLRRDTKYTYRIRAFNADGFSDYSNEASATTGQQSALDENEDDQILPKRFSLGQNFPNPFNPETNISFELPTAAEIDISIFDVQGRKVKSLIAGRKSAGAYQITWDGRDDTGRFSESGLYMFRLLAPGFVETRKLILLR